MYSRNCFSRAGFGHGPDLLVIVALICLFISILLPSLASARQKAALLVLQQAVNEYKLTCEALRPYAGEFAGSGEHAVALERLNSRDAASKQLLEKAESLLSSKPDDVGPKSIGALAGELDKMREPLEALMHQKFGSLLQLEAQRRQSAVDKAAWSYFFLGVGVVVGLRIASKIIGVIIPRKRGLAPA